MRVSVPPGVDVESLARALHGVSGLAGTNMPGAPLVPGPTATITVTGAQMGEITTSGSDYSVSAGGSMCYVMPLQAGTLAGTFAQVGPPASERMTGEYFVAGASATSADFSVTRSVKQAFSTLADRTLALPPALAMPTLTDQTSGGTYLRLQAEFTVPPELEGVVFLDYSTTDINVSVFAMQGILSGDVTLSMPDLESLTGWDNSWMIPAAATGVEYTIGAGFGEDVVTNFQSGLCADNGTLVISSYTGDYN